ncbi:hypothetical protein G9P44_002693 [Scheffersomyces stipitis]|nr:hypothetical protein G9P44_002693 [Scheffersomyces stipitis]
MMGIIIYTVIQYEDSIEGVTRRDGPFFIVPQQPLQQVSEAVCAFHIEPPKDLQRL